MQDVCTDQEMAQLLERARRRDPAALDRLYQLYVDKVYRYIWYRVEDQATAEDLAMDVFVRLAEHIGKFRAPKQNQVAAFSAWLFRIAGNCVIDYRRRKGRGEKAMEKMASSVLEDEESFEGQLERIAMRSHVRSALEMLTREQRQVLYYRFAADLTSSQTAVVMKKSETAIKALQHRALASLRRLLAAQRGHGDASS